ncbi:MAG: GIY-YIG nuclease family protein [Oscillospiraceae bacterium]
MENKSKKEQIAKYKEREQIGGICIIRNTVTNKILLISTTDLQGSKNSFEFSQKVGSCASMKLQKDFTEFGVSAFSFEVLEELKKGENQTDEEFKQDIKLLNQIWTENLADKNLY